MPLRRLPQRMWRDRYRTAARRAEEEAETKRVRLENGAIELHGLAGERMDEGPAECPGACIQHQGARLIAEHSR